MTWDRLRQWLLPAAALVVCLLLALAANLARHRGEDLARQAEAARLDREGLLRERDAAAAELRAARDRAARIPEIEADLARLRAIAGRTTTTDVLHARTRPGRVQIPATPHEGGAAPSPAPPSPSNGALAGEGRVLVLTETSELSVEVDSLTEQTRAGNRVVVGAASCWLEPGPELPIQPRHMLYRGAFSAPLSSALGAPEERVPRWGAGVVAIAGPKSVGAGPALLLPPVRVWGIQGEGTAGCAAGSGGLAGCVLIAGVRW